MLEQIEAELASGIVGLAGTALTILFAFGMNYLKAKADDIKNDTLRKALKESFVEAERVGTLSIKAVRQSLVDDLKEAKEDGKLSDKEKKQAIDEAKRVFVKNLSQESINTLERQVGDLDDWLGGFLEGKLKEEKENKIKNEVLKLSDPN